MKTELTINQKIKYSETVKFEFPNAQAAAIVMDILMKGVPADGTTSFTINVFNENKED